MEGGAARGPILLRAGVLGDQNLRAGQRDVVVERQEREYRRDEADGGDGLFADAAEPERVDDLLDDEGAAT